MSLNTSGKVVRVGLCGLGTVGGAVFNVLARNSALIHDRTGVEIRIVHIGARRDNPALNTGPVKVSRDIFAVVRDRDVDVVVELIGGTTVAKDLVMEAIANGKHVVTANKALIAHHGAEIFSAAKNKGLTISFEAAVAGAIPVIKALREGLAANRIEWLAGIINGTTNFILTEMSEKGRAFDEVLKEAQALGYAEADPTFDVEGIDAAHKLVILAAIAFGIPLEVDKIFTEGITRLDIRDVNYAKELGYRIRHLGIARRNTKGIELRVHPTLIPQSRLIANVSGVMNAVMVMGDASGPTLYNGRGAGGEPTASAVIADLVDVARNLSTPYANRVPALGFVADSVRAQPVVPIADIESSYYLRITANDKPGVLSKITQILSDAGISIEAVIQKEPLHGETTVPLILLTSRILEKTMREVIEQIEASSVVEGRVISIRVEMLDK
jgi:homoserine dehydrogenase